MRIRNGAADHRDRDSWLGGTMAILGGGVVGVGVGMAAQSGHKTEYYGEWAAISGVGAGLVGLGIYFLTRGGDDRQEYWATNAAVAQTRADYASYPSSATYSTNWVDLEKKIEELNKEKIEAQVAQTKATSDATFAEAQLKAAQDASKGNDGGSGDKPKPDAPTPKAPPQPSPPPGPPLFGSDPYKAVVDAHNALDAANAKLAEATRELTLATNELSARQAAWAHCAAALQAIGSVDATANSSFAAAFGAAAGGSAKASGASSGGGK